jgi:hypothetical protein
MRQAAAAASTAQAEAAQAAADAITQLRSVVEKLQAQVNDDAAAQAALLKTLDDASQTAATARNALAKAAEDADRSSKAAVAAEQEVSFELENLRRAIAGLDVTQLKSSVSRASLAAQQLSVALEKAASEQPRPHAAVATDHQK